MLAEAAPNLSIDLERTPDFYTDRQEVEPADGHPPTSLWDEVAKRWPNGGRFPSFIMNDARI